MWVLPCQWDRVAQRVARLAGDSVQMTYKYEKGSFFCKGNFGGTSVQSAYLKILSLGSKLFAFLVKWSLEGAFGVLFSSLGTLWFI